MEKNKKCSKKTIIITIILSSLIAIALIAIIIYFATKDNNKEEEIKKNNTLELIYYTTEEDEELTLFSSHILTHISSLQIDGTQKEVISHYYIFNTVGEHRIKIQFKTNLVSLSELFKYNTNLIQADFSDIETKNINDTSDMFYGCSTVFQELERLFFCSQKAGSLYFQNGFLKGN